MTLKELREYRLICSEIDYIDKCMQCSTDKKSSVARLKRKSELIKEKNRLESFLESINNFKIRFAIELYCFETVSVGENFPTWENVARKIGNGATGDSIRKKVERYLNS